MKSNLNAAITHLYEWSGRKLTDRFGAWKRRLVGDARQASDSPDPSIQKWHQRDAIGVEVRSIVQHDLSNREGIRAILPLEGYFDEKIPSRRFGNSIFNILYFLDKASNF